MIVRPGALPALLFAVLTLLVAGCGGDDEKTASATPAATETPASTSTPESEAETEEAEGEDGDSEAEREREEQEAEGASSKDCAEAGDLDGDPKVKPPADLSVPAYAHVYKSEGPFGKTTRFYAVLDGTPDDLASRRDDAQNELVQNQSYQSLSTDQEEGAEAEAHLKGPEHTVDIQVAPLCEGKIRIRYTVS
ncbi:hypothetical protein [Solirubrobacter soli]|uniref:hypothetical protein n=1 Tax=Solirubrobacter soli TaxID=363832 RepID=UPI0004172F36|nr:hypothetical protein [Solirubrobacter soli]